MSILFFIFFIFFSDIYKKCVFLTKKGLFMDLGNRVKARMDALKMNQGQLSLRLGYKSRASINKILNEGGRGIPFNKIPLFASVLKTTPEYLLGWVDDPQPKEQDGAETGFAAESPGILTLIEELREANRDYRQTVRVLQETNYKLVEKLDDFQAVPRVVNMADAGGN